VIGKINGNFLNLPEPGDAANVAGQITPADLMKTIRRSPQG